MQRIVPQHLLDTGKLTHRFSPGLELTGGALLFLRLLLRRKFFLHVTSSGFLKVQGEGLASTMEFAAHGVGRLFR